MKKIILMLLLFESIKQCFGLIIRQKIIISPIEDVSTKIKKIIIDNKNKFYNFNEKKFIIFFEGWERKKHINFDDMWIKLHSEVRLLFITPSLDSKNT